MSVQKYESKHLRYMSAQTETFVLNGEESQRK